MKRLLDFDLISAVILAACFLLFAWTHDAPRPRRRPELRVRPVEAQTIQGKTIAWWHRAAVQERRAATVLRRALHGSTTIEHAIDLAAIAYRVDAATLRRKASCESTGGHGYDPRARNTRSGAAGLFQFLPSTWRTTPFARFSPYDPLAAALAAGWMHANGRGGEWVCR